MTSDLCMSSISVKLDIKDKGAGGSGKCMYRLIKNLTVETAIFSLGPERVGKSPGHLPSEEKRFLWHLYFFPPHFFLLILFQPPPEKSFFLSC